MPIFFVVHEVLVRLLLQSFLQRRPIPKDCVAAITGAIDLVADSTTCYAIRNGHPMMGKVTGTGCQLSGLMTAFITANPDQILEAAVAAVCTMGLAGEIAYSHSE